MELIKSIEQIINKISLLVADKEGFTKELYAEVLHNKKFDLLGPAQQTQRTKEVVSQLDYKRISTGVALSETLLNFEGDEKLISL
ncbi:MAG: hypothetical protein WCX31_00120 [Salinivirgaceae bacterium]|jgi:hypothetical protein